MIRNSWFQRYRTGLSLLLIAVGVAVLYGSALGNGFVLDDQTLIEKNEFLERGLGGVIDCFSSEYWSGTGFNFGVYRPLTMSSFLLEKSLIGLSPVSAHLINLILFTIVVWLFFLSLLEVLPDAQGSVGIATTATLLFLVHPVHVEIVAYVKSRDELLCLLGGLISIYALFLSRRSRRWRAPLLLVSAIAYLGALFAKETAVMFPILLAILLFFREPGIGFKPTLKLFSSFCLATLVFFTARHLALSGAGAGPYRDAVTFPFIGMESWVDRWTTALWIGARYAALIFVPQPLLSDYSYNQIPPVAGFSPLGVVFNAGLVVVVAAISIFYGRRCVAGLGALLFGTALVVPLLYTLIYGFSMADRMLAIPSIGGVLLLASLFQRLPRPVSTLVVGVIVVGFGALTFQRTLDWKTNLSLFEADEPKAPRNSKLAFLLGRELERKAAQMTGPEQVALLTRAIGLLEKSLQISPDVPEVMTELGVSYGQRGDYQAARRMLDLSLERKVNDEALFFSGLLDLREQKTERAKIRFAETLRLNPRNLRAQLELEKLNR